MMKTLNKDYTVEVDTVDEKSWPKILKQFDDANIFQTSIYCKMRREKGNVSHLVLKHNGEVISACHIMVVKVPLIRKGIAYALWGPLWRLHGKKEDFEVFRQMIRALRDEYVVRRGLFLRLQPNIIDDGSNRVTPILRNKGFKLNPSIAPYRTLLVDLSPSLEELRKNIKPRWRSYLNKVEKNCLKVIEGTEDELFTIFASMHKEMVDRKQLFTSFNMSDYAYLQTHLPKPLKMRILVVECDEKPVSAIVCGTLGNTGVYLLGATSTNGLQTRGSYLIQWKMIEWLKKRNYQWYDLHGYDPIENPGTSQFKAGLAGKRRKNVYYIGHYEACENLISFLLVKFVDAFRSYYRSMRKHIHRFSHHWH
ncbi:peptidoglycan bridge formation glycyltransferase FemA/FemB family protein [bacterium]|nr:peptidoglycan bridge formation glycyltransferase FemA/FemB family protein [bacterium]